MVWRSNSQGGISLLAKELVEEDEIICSFQFLNSSHKNKLKWWERIYFLIF